jgi:hypothetical protein
VHFCENLIFVEKVNNKTTKQKRLRDEVHFQHLRKEHFFFLNFFVEKVKLGSQSFKEIGV